MTREEQLEKWISGVSLHNDELDECCPDFSCCCEGISTPVEVKKAFRDAYIRGDSEEMERMLWTFLSDAIPKIVKNDNVRSVILIGE